MRLILSLWLAHRFTPEQRAVIDQLHASFPLAVVEDYEYPSPTDHPKTVLNQLHLKTKTSTING